MIMKEILPIIMDTSFQRLAVIDDYSSLIWTKRYYACGDFELCVSVDQVNTSLFQKHYYVVRDDDDEVGVIEDIKINKNADGDELMIITGRFLESILGRRIIAVQTSVSGAISNCINTLINQNVINPSASSRKINNFILGTYSFTTSIEAQYTGDNLLTVIEQLCETYGIGFKVTLNNQNQFVFQLYEGVDHTYDQTTNPWVIFSDEYDNLVSYEYEENYKDIATAVLVAGEGEGLDRKTAWSTNGATGINRFEFYKDQRDLQSNDGAISESKYTAMLKEIGKQLITTYTQGFTGDVYFDADQNENVKVGDLVVIENKKWNVRVNSRIVEMIESVSEAGEHKIIPTFGA